MTTSASSTTVEELQKLPLQEMPYLPERNTTQSRAEKEFSNSLMGKLFYSNWDEISEENLLAFWSLYTDYVMEAKAQERASFFALLIEVVSRPRTTRSDELQLALSRAKTNGTQKAIDLASNAVEEDRNERAPPVEGQTIGRKMMVQLIEHFKKKVQETLDAAKLAKTKKSTKKAAAAAAAVQPEQAAAADNADDEQEVVDLF